MLEKGDSADTGCLFATVTRFPPLARTISRHVHAAWWQAKFGTTALALRLGPYAPLGALSAPEAPAQVRWTLAEKYLSQEVAALMTTSVVSVRRRHS